MEQQRKGAVRIGAWLEEKVNIAIKATNEAAFLDRKEEKENE